MVEPSGSGAALHRLSARGLHVLMRRREVSAVEVTSAFLERIAGLDGQLNAFVRTNPRALDQARDADRRYASDGAGPLTGVPVAIKDNLATDGLETSCGSAILAGFVPAGDAAAVERLRRAGAVVLGKTNLDEFGMGSSTENSVHGAVRNPWDTSRVAGGSSGGSAAAVAARLAPLALGSDTGGSVRQPAAFCGVVGVKPTYGRVSRRGLVAYGSSLDQVGPLAHDTRDAAELLRCIAGADPRDMTCSSRPVEEYTRACDGGVAGMCVGLPEEYLGAGADRGIARAVRAAAAELERQGARVETVSLPHTRFAVPVYYLVATAEASSNLARYDGVRFGRRVDRDGASAAMYAATRGRGFGAEVKRRIMLGTFALTAGYHEEYYGKAMRARVLLRQEFSAIFARDVHLLLAPTTPTAAFRLGEKLDDPLSMYLSDVFTVPASLAGLPALSVPVGHDEHGLPIGAQLIGPPFGESRLFRAAAVLERRFPAGLPGEPDRSAGDRTSRAEGPRC